ncbi:MAG: putative transport system permease protein [Clostridiales bacterium]|nr:putative transport system permease protein [Clostridiales bacterium]
MLNVSNKGYMIRLNAKRMKAAKTRYLVAVFAIALTCVLFTSLFTIALSINAAIEQANFRQAGGYSHGTFKYLTKDEFDELKTDALIKQHGLRKFIGMAEDASFQKSHVEIGYSDQNQAHWMYCDPIEGSLPKEGTHEAATDTHVLALLGVKPELGASFTLTFTVDGTSITEDFILSGWWEYDEAVAANHVLLPESRASEIYQQVGIGDGIGNDGMTGTYNMDIMLKSARSIESTMQKIANSHGYQILDPAKPSFLATGVNWGYTGARFSSNMDFTTLFLLIFLLFIILLTGYLIIYNVFLIAVSNDIHFYGLLKTIGTTRRQLKRMIRQQAFILALLGIPFGLIIGYAIGSRLTPLVLSQLNGVEIHTVSLHPAIFIGASLFSLMTVMISCEKPGKIAAAASPIEAIHFVERRSIKKRKRKTRTGHSIFWMAMANLSRNTKKTVLTILSLTLSVLLFHLTYTFTNGFDMDKYLIRMGSDFIVSDSNYFQVGNGFDAEHALLKEDIKEFTSQKGIEDGSFVYGTVTDVREFVEEAHFRERYEKWNDEETIDHMISLQEKEETGKITDNVQLYGMESYALGKVTLLAGDLSKLYEPGKRYIAAVYQLDDYGNPIWDSNWPKIGDMVRLRFDRKDKKQDIDYQVVAQIAIPSSLSLRYYGSDEFVLNAQTFIQDTHKDDIMYYACDATDAGTASLEDFLAKWTKTDMPQLNYESKASYEKEFTGFRNLFLLLGGLLSLVVGLVGVLNFFNTIMTGIFARRRELAMLASIGMTGKQVSMLLVLEGVLYAAISFLTTVIFSLTTAPVLSKLLSQMFWFFTYHFTMVPILMVFPFFFVIAAVVPNIVYHFLSKEPLIEQIHML